MSKPTARFNVLAISPTPTHVTNRGNRKRIRAVLEAIKSEGGRIHFIYFPREWGMKINVEEYDDMNAAWEESYVVHPSTPVLSSCMGDHYKIDDWWDENIGSFINWLSWSKFFDLVIVNYAFFSKAFDHLNPAFLKVLDTHDVLAGRRQLLENNGLPPDFFYTTSKEENIGLNRSDVIIAIKQSEATYFRSQTTKPVVVLGHYEFHNRRPVSPSPEVIRFGYIASENPINVENIKRFTSAFIRALSASTATCKLIIAGLICNVLKGERLFQHHAIVLIGRVENIDDFYDNHVDVIVSPFDFGTGLKIKTMEALSYGKPVLGTRHAFEGVQTDEPMHNFKDVETLAEACIALAVKPEPVLARLNMVTAAIQNKIEAEFSHSIQGLVEATRARRVLFITPLTYWREEGVYEKRTARIIRYLSRYFHVHAIYPGELSQNDKDKMRDWQWGTSVYSNETSLTEEEFCHVMLRNINPSILYQQKSYIAHTTNVFTTINDIVEIDYLHWSLCSDTNRDKSVNTILITTTYDLAVPLRLASFDKNFVVPLMPIDVRDRSGDGLAIIVCKGSHYHGLVDLINEAMATCESWNGIIDVFDPERGVMIKSAGSSASPQELILGDYYIDGQYRICLDTTGGVCGHDLSFAFGVAGVPRIGFVGSSSLGYVIESWSLHEMIVIMRALYDSKSLFDKHLRFSLSRYREVASDWLIHPLKNYLETRAKAIQLRVITQ